MKKLNIYILFITAIFTTSILAQEINTNEEIKLMILVQDENNKPIPGAVILLDDVRQKRLTNSAGYFKIKLAKQPKIITAFSPSIGVKKVNYKASKILVIKIISEINTAGLLNEDRNIKNENPIQFRDIYDYLRGKVAGVNISAGNVITIRGYNSINGSTTPLFIVNGNQVEQSFFGSIVPTDIKSIQVLKSTDTAIYGARGANGVIKVTTF